MVKGIHSNNIHGNIIISTIIMLYYYYIHSDIKKSKYLRIQIFSLFLGGGAIFYFHSGIHSNRYGFLSGYVGGYVLLVFTSGSWLSDILCERSTRSFTKRAKVRARNPAPNLMLGMLARGTGGSWEELN